MSPHATLAFGLTQGCPYVRVDLVRFSNPLLDESVFLSQAGTLSRVDPTCHLKNDSITSNQVGQAVHIPLESSNFDSCEVQSGGGQDDQEDHDQSEATHPNDNRTITINFNY